MSEDNQLRLQLLYRHAFGEERHNYFEKYVDLNVGSWMSDLNVIIDESYRNKIGLGLTNSEKLAKLMRYLMQKNDINKYKMFILIWKKNDLAIAKQFEENLLLRIREEDLSEVDEQFQTVLNLGK